MINNALHRQKVGNGFLAISLMFIFFSCNFTGSQKVELNETPIKNFFSISGVVYDLTGDRVPYIEIALDGFERKATLTDEDGSYHIDNIPQGRYTIEANKKGDIFIPLISHNKIDLTSDKYGFDFVKIDGTLLDKNRAITINEIQGDKHISPYKELEVTNVIGVVTAVKIDTYEYNEYQELYIQNPAPDNNPNTSEGIRLITSTGELFNTGDLILVKTALVRESLYNKIAGSYYNDNLSRTELLVSANDIVLIKNGLPLPPAVVIGYPDKVIPTKYFKKSAYNNEASHPQSEFDPLNNGIDFFETLEGMRIQINNALCVGGNDENNEVALVTDNGNYSDKRSLRGGMLLAEDYSDFNPEIILASYYFVPYKNYKVGDRFELPIYGIIDYTYRRYKFLVTESLPGVKSYLKEESTTISKNPDKLTICSYNVENLAPFGTPNGSKKKIDGIAKSIVHNLLLPDILGLVEVQDNSGNLDLGDVSCDITMNQLVDSIKTQSNNSVNYKYCYINPIYNAEGGEPGGNIRVVFMYNPDRVDFIAKPDSEELGKNPSLYQNLETKGVTVINNNGKIGLSLNPGRIEPLNPVFDYTRISLIGEFYFKGEQILIILNHLSAKGGDNSLYGNIQPPIFNSEPKRVSQAKVIHNFIKELVDIDKNTNIVVLGDFNDFHFSQTIRLIKGEILTNLIDNLPQNDRYSYIYEGNSQILDNILISDNLSKKNPEIDIVHINSEFSYNENFSDHDPVLCALTFGTNSGDTTPPVWKKDFPKIINAKCYSIDLSVDLSEQSKVYFIGTEDLLLNPTLENIFSGLDNKKEPYIINGFFNYVPGSKNNITINDFLPDTAYNLFFVCKDNSLNISDQIQKITTTTKSEYNRYYASELFISEYVEGSGYNKAIEIFNYTGYDIDLSDYSIVRDGNSDGIFQTDNSNDKELKLTGYLSHNDTFVIINRNDTVISYLKEIADMRDSSQTGALGFNGDDPIALFKNGIEIDRIGIPNVVFGENKTFVRASSVYEPSPFEVDPRDSKEWLEYEEDTFEFLGWHRYDP